MRPLAYIEKIKSLKPITNADSIECAEVLGWEVVVKKGDFKVDDLVIYCEIDSVLPELPCFEFLRSKKFRIRTVKLRGQISQGIIFPIYTLSQINESFKLSSLTVGDDVTSALQITKYDPESSLDVKEQNQPKKSWLLNKWSFIKWKLFNIKPSKIANDFPSDVPKTDETRVQHMEMQLQKRIGELVYITEKCEGSSATFVYRKHNGCLSKVFGKAYTFEICSRNRMVYSSDSGGDTTHYLYHLAHNLKILEAFNKFGKSLVIQGESLGPKIQGNFYKLPEHTLRVFLMYDLDSQAYLPYHQVVSISKEMGLSMVPVLDDNVFIVDDIKYYVELSKGKSQINSNLLREGIVVRSMKDNFSFKSINPEYLLKQE